MCRQSVDCHVLIRSPTGWKGYPAPPAYRVAFKYVRDEQLRPVVLPTVLLAHTDALVSAVQRYHSALAQMMAAEYTIREVVDNALLAGVSTGAVRGIINSFAEAANTPLLHASDVDPRLDGDDQAALGVDTLVADLAARHGDGTVA